jgi:hypothetical protein
MEAQIMSVDSPTQIATLKPTYSAREAAALLGRSYSWLDQRLRQGDFVQPDGTSLQALRSPGGYRYFTFQMIIDIACCCYRHRWYSFGQLNSVFHELAVAAYRDADKYEGPVKDLIELLVTGMTDLMVDEALSETPITDR